MKIRGIVLLVSLSLFTGGCGHGPLNQFHDEETSGGRQTMIGELERDYTTPMDRAVAAVRQWFKSSGATLDEDRLSSSNRAVLDGRLRDGTGVQWTVTQASSAPSGVTTVAVLVGDRDMKEAAQALDAMERSLGAKRVMPVAAATATPEQTGK